ncbi:hypothetical protein KEM48_011231 [Puccinia striiformis f. sp. tritici PST-130]|nr:hypothetical protein KEM48_011231 [Puccinia striiformis f. sp. tritici PST-130]
MNYSIDYLIGSPLLSLLSDPLLSIQTEVLPFRYSSSTKGVDTCIDTATFTRSIDRPRRLKKKQWMTAVAYKNTLITGISTQDSVFPSADASHNTNHAQDIGHATLAHHLTSTEPPQAMNVSTSSGALNVTAVDHPNHIPAPTSITNTQADTPDIKLEKPTTSDPALDEDAPHEDDDDDDADDADDNDDEEGGNEEPSSTNPRFPMAIAIKRLLTSTLSALELQIPLENGSATPIKAAVTLRRLAGIQQTQADPRIKSAEQLEREALIEQQNPNATKNELRSLKLRALHAIRITERELNMPEAEKQRRLRLREYVRHKREEERRIKRSSKPVDTADAEIKPGSQSSTFPTPTYSSSDQWSLTSVESTRVSLWANRQQFTKANQEWTTKLIEEEIWYNTSCQAFSDILRGRNQETNPHASPTQLKSLKLRALHADRIAVREENMSEKEKTRRQKLREYMRRRRDEERVEKGQEPTQLSTAQETNTALDSVLAYRRSLESHPHHQSNDGRMTALSGTAIVPEGMNADDRLAAFSMMELTNNYHHQHHHQQFSPQTHAVQPTTSNLHLHPLFQYPRPDHDHQSLEGFNRLNHHHHHHQLDHDHQILGIDHAHELALIAAAAAEVEHAHLVHASTSSTSNSNSNSTDPSSLLLR